MTKSASLNILVANRGEIALRLHRGLQALGHSTVAVYSEADRRAPYVGHASTAHAIGPASPTQSYLDIDRIIATGRKAKVNAVHPGYGFLSENPQFAAAVEAEGWTFIGPTPDSMRLMGDKIAARAAAERAGVPVVPAVDPPENASAKEIMGLARDLGTPLMIKAAAGGGGKGMRVVRDLAELEASLAAARREAQNAFGDDRVFLERFIDRGRHVEVQVLGDGAGDARAVGERDCSIQRRHQKIIEECPAPSISAQLRREIQTAAVALTAGTEYRGAGTVEFILADDGAFYFLEMNTRLQVEHPVTELVYGVDLVGAQIDIACGRGIPEIGPARGHAVEVRVYAEDPAVGFLPSIGTLEEVVWPHGPGIRVDAGVEAGNVVTVDYDPMLGKIIAWGQDRDEAITRLRDALCETFIAGVQTSMTFCHELLDHPSFRSADIHTNFIEEHYPDWEAELVPSPWREAALAAARRLTAGGGAGQTGASSAAPSLWEQLGSWRQMS